MTSTRIQQIISALISSVFLFHTVIFFLVNARGLYLFSLLILIGFLFCWVLLKGRHDDLFSLAALLGYSIFSFLAVVLTGGIHSSAALLLFFIPVFAALTAGTGLTLGLSAVTAVFCLALFFFDLLHIHPVPVYPVVNINPFHTGYLFICLASGIAAGYGFGSRQQAFRKDLDRREQDMAQIRKEAERAVSAKRDFLANMSHEIRNPMNGIIGMMHVILESKLDNDQRKYVNIVYSSARALLSIVNDILDFSKIEAGKMELDIRNFDLRVAMEDITALHAIQARQKGIGFSCRIHSDVPGRVKGDPGRLRQIIDNLTGNAIKFTHNGEVVITVQLVSETEGRAVIKFSVDDTGIGIAPEKIDSLFESFTQADVSTTKKYGGTGLGLSITRLIIEKMGGTIGVDSVEMVGSTFWFEIPFEKQKVEDPAQAVFDLDITYSKILVTSDDLLASGCLEDMLTATGLEYETAQTNEEAVDKLRQASLKGYPFHLLICDVHESDVQAEKLGRSISQDREMPPVRFILLSSIGKKGDARRFEDAGFSAFLTKPVEKNLLLDCFKAVLAGKAGSSIITRYSIDESKKSMVRILVVDDQQTNLLTARALLDRLGYCSIPADSGEKAVQAHLAKPFDLILMDCQMPDMDGFEATRKIREFEESQPFHTPIIAMTGNATRKDRDQCMAAGMDDFIAKPVEPDALSAKIQSNLLELFQFKTLQSDTLPSAIPGAGPSYVPAADDQAVVRFDRVRLLARFGNCEDIADSVIESFTAEAPELMEKIRNALAADDSDSLRAGAHALKGSAANVNAEKLSALARDLEEQARAADMVSARSTVVRIETEYQMLIEEITP